MQETATLPALAIAEIEALHRDHKLWLNSGGRQGRRAVLKKTFLTDLDLSGYQFAQASMRGAVLRNVKLCGADLRDCDFSEAVLENVDFSGAQLANATFVRAALQQVSFRHTEMGGADLLGVHAKQLQCIGAMMDNTILRDAQLHGVNFSHAKLNDAMLKGAVCVHATFDGADMSRADCRGAIFDCAGFAGTLFTGTLFKDATLNAINLKDTDFTGAQDLAFDPQVQELVDERARLAAKNRVVNEQHALVNKDKRKIAAQEADLRQREERLAYALATLKKLCLVFAVICVLWLAISGTLLSFTVSRVVEIGLGRISIILGAVGVVLLLSLSSLYFSVRARQLLMEVVDNAQKTDKRT